MPGALEVRRSSSPEIWYNAQLEYLSDEGVVCTFEGDVWPSEKFAMKDVRFCAPQRVDTEVQDYQPPVGHVVEVEVPATNSSPKGWQTAEVRGRSGQWIYLGIQNAYTEIIMPITRIRPCSTSSAVEGHLQKVEMPLDLALDDSVSMLRAKDCFCQVEQMATGAYELDAVPSQELLHVRLTENGDVMMTGTAVSLQRAQLLMPAMLHHERQVRQWKDALRLRQEALAKRTSTTGKMQLQFSDDFLMDVAFVGQLIGKGGSKIKALEAEHDAKITILDGPSVKQKRVTICTRDKDVLVRLREKIQIIEETLQVDPCEKQWTVAGGTMDSIAQHSGLQRIRVDNENNTLVLKGTQLACQRAKTLFQAHLSYFSVFEKLDAQLEGMMQRLRDNGQLDEELLRDSLGKEQRMDREEQCFPNGMGKGKTMQQELWDAGSKGVGKGKRTEADQQESGGKGKRSNSRGSRTSGDARRP
eukprot:TRINITY_DN87994_c0_g1_i1.p1 TRINITY_DN87994_c0_g1~~TRINITY_DN87994_c0_g1_i1.p1  ORF type:complete len:471 (-),score=93.27 TRINITY_DN87994_c0_g1_i1:425-1837(-)